MADQASTPERRYVRVGEAARLAGVASTEILRRIDEGMLSARRNRDGMIVVPADELGTITR